MTATVIGQTQYCIPLLIKMSMYLVMVYWIFLKYLFVSFICMNDNNNKQGLTKIYQDSRNHFLVIKPTSTTHLVHVVRCSLWSLLLSSFTVYISSWSCVWACIKNALLALLADWLHVLIKFSLSTLFDSPFLKKNLAEQIKKKFPPSQ